MSTNGQREPTDKQRLDWLSRHPYCCFGMVQRQYPWKAQPQEQGVQIEYRGTPNEGLTFRDAIDAAMKADGVA